MEAPAETPQGVAADGEGLSRRKKGWEGKICPLYVCFLFSPVILFL